MAPKLTRDNELIRTARAVLQLQRRIAKARRQIKAWQADLKHERKILRGLAYAAENGPNVAPSRLTGGATGHVLPTRARTLEQQKAHDHAASCDGTLRPPMLPDSTLWICDVCSFAVEQD